MKLAVIPARGGSKRIPGKNMRDFCGKPIIAYSIETALKSGLFDHVIVSTDDEKIASLVTELGAEVPFSRPMEISDDHTGTNVVVKHAIEWYQKNGHDVSLVCCIYATAPFLQAKYLSAGYDLLLKSPKSFVFSVTNFAFPIQRAVRINRKGSVEAFWPEHINSRSQDLEEAFHDAGQFYWGQAQSFLEELDVFSNVSLPIVLPRHLVQDIDTEEDWKLAELMYKRQQMSKGGYCGKL